MRARSSSRAKVEQETHTGKDVDHREADDVIGGSKVERDEGEAPEGETGRSESKTCRVILEKGFKLSGLEIEDLDGQHVAVARKVEDLFLVLDQANVGRSFRKRADDLEIKFFAVAGTGLVRIESENNFRYFSIVPQRTRKGFLLSRW